MPSDRARAAVARGDWPLAYELLRGLVDAPDTDPDDVDALADAAWWLCRAEESIAHRQRAYAGHAATGRPSRAQNGGGSSRSVGSGATGGGGSGFQRIKVSGPEGGGRSWSGLSGPGRVAGAGGRTGSGRIW